MTHADAFLQDILAHPDDDAPRLIFADWLEEQGDANSVARAEFIRVQWVLAAGQLPETRRTELERRQQQILDQWGKEWVRPIRRLVRSWEFHRGFIDEVGMLAPTFLKHAGQLFRRAPIQHLALRRDNNILASSCMAELADSEHLRRLRSLDLGGNQLESRHLRALVVSEYLTGLTSLDLMSNRIGDGGIRALASSPLLGRLERLNLGYNDIGANGLRALARALEALADSTEGLHLQRLEIYHPNLSAAGLRVIAESAVLRRVVGN